MDPYAPITPEQEQAIRVYLAGLGRLTRERLLKQCPGLHRPHALDAGQAATILGRLRGEPTPPVVPATPADPAATRATIDALREKLDTGYAGRKMQPVGLSKPSLTAGCNGNPHAATR